MKNGEHHSEIECTLWPIRADLPYLCQDGDKRKTTPQTKPCRLAVHQPHQQVKLLIFRIVDESK